MATKREYIDVPALRLAQDTPVGGASDEPTIYYVVEIETGCGPSRLSIGRRVPQVVGCEYGTTVYRPPQGRVMDAAAVYQDRIYRVPVHLPMVAFGSEAEVGDDVRRAIRKHLRTHRPELAAAE